jgi:hypothetical protein
MSYLPTGSARRLVRAGVHGLVLLAAVVAAGCQKSIDIKASLQVIDATTGWFDAGVVDGRNKLVPSVSFRLRNTSDQEIDAVSINLVFEFVDTGEDQEEVFKQRIPFENRQTELITVRSQTGFTGDPPQSRADMLKHSAFRDMNAIIFVRQAGAQWVELHRVRIERQLLTQ